MQVLVTGATGFVGSHIVEALLAVGHHPVALVRRSGNARLLHSLGVPIRYGDITDRNSLGGTGGMRGGGTCRRAGGGCRQKGGL